MIVTASPALTFLFVRPYALKDGRDTLRVFHEAVRRGAASAYTAAELSAWVAPALDAAAWIAARSRYATWVAEQRGEVIGFVDLTADGEIDMLFVHPDHTRRGVGSALLKEVELRARTSHVQRLHARASLVGEPVFARAGFVVRRRQWAERNGERLTQAVMEKVLEPGA